MQDLGPYRIERELGRGAMGVVYLARHTTLNRPVALKVLNPQHAASEEITARFEREIKGGARVQHPNVVRVLDAGLFERVPYLALELVDGGALGDLILRAQRIPWPLALAITARVLEGLAHLHELGILHRDIKPGNVLLGSDGGVRITDFGLATYAGATALTEPGLVVGTMTYMAPELFRDGQATQATDVFAAGVTLYVLITGRVPMAVDPLPTFVARMTANDFVAPHEMFRAIPAAVSRFTGALMDGDPARRGGDARARARQCEALLEELTGKPADAFLTGASFSTPSQVSESIVRPVTRPPRKTAATPRRRWRYAVPLAVGALVAAGMFTRRAARPAARGPVANDLVLDAANAARAPRSATDVWFALPPNEVHADVDGDGRTDLVRGAPPGQPPFVTVTSGRTGERLLDMPLYEPGFTGGVNVATGDVDGDGAVDLVVAPGRGRVVEVHVIRVRDRAITRTFDPYETAFQGGCNVAAGDVDGDGRADVLTGPGKNGGPHVNLWSGRGDKLLSAMAFEPGVRTGVRVALIDADRDGRLDLVFTAGDEPGAPGRVYSAATGRVTQVFDRGWLPPFEHWRLHASGLPWLRGPDAQARWYAKALQERAPLVLGGSPRTWAHWLELGAWLARSPRSDHPPRYPNAVKGDLLGSYDPTAVLGSMKNIEGPSEMMVQTALDMVGSAPEDARGWLLFGRVLDESAFPETALVAYQRGLKLLPEQPFPWSGPRSWSGLARAWHRCEPERLEANVVRWVERMKDPEMLVDGIVDGLAVEAPGVVDRLLKREYANPALPPVLRTYRERFEISRKTKRQP